MDEKDLTVCKEYASTANRYELRVLMDLALSEKLALEWVILAYLKSQRFSASLDVNKYNLEDQFHKVRKYQITLIEHYKNKYGK